MGCKEQHLILALEATTSVRTRQHVRVKHELDVGLETLLGLAVSIIHDREVHFSERTFLGEPRDVEARSGSRGRASSSERFGSVCVPQAHASGAELLRPAAASR